MSQKNRRRAYSVEWDCLPGPKPRYLPAGYATDTLLAALRSVLSGLPSPGCLARAHRGIRSQFQGSTDP
jgi:hypothetical protein